MDDTGYITRPKLRAAYERIWQHNEPLCRMRASEAFLNTIARMAKYWGVSFDDAADRLGY